MNGCEWLILILAGGLAWFLTALLVGTIVGRCCNERDDKLDVDAALHREETWK